MRTRVEKHSTSIVLIVTALAIVMAIPGIHWLLTLAALGAVSVLAAIHPAVVVAAVVASIPVQSSVVIPFIRGELTVTQLLLFGLILGWGALFWRRRIWLDSVTVGFLLVLAAYSISFIAVDEPNLWFQETYRWAVAGIFYVICRSTISSWMHVRWMLWAMSAGVLAMSLASAVQIVGGVGPSQFLVGGVIRVYGSFGTPNTLAAYLEMTVPMLFACLALAWWGGSADRFNTLEKWLFAAAGAAGVLTIGLTQSRGGWIGIAVASLVIWLNIPGRTKWIAAGAAVLVMGGFLLTAPGQSQLSRFGDSVMEVEPGPTLDNRSSYDVGAGRGALWGAARSMIADNPLTGVGAGEFDEQYREYSPNWIDRFPRGQAHDVWLQMGAQAGVWGILAYACWFVASVWSIITARRRLESGPEYWIVTGVLAVFAAYALHSLVDYLNVLSLGLQLSVLTAIALNLAPEPLTRYQTEARSPGHIPLLEPTPCPQ